MPKRSRNDEVQEFAFKHRLKTKIHEDETKIIPGKFGHIYGYGNGLLGVIVMPNPPRRQYWGCLRVVLLNAGFTIVQDADGEGAASFDRSDAAQAKAAIRAAGIKRRRQISPEQRQEQIARLRASAGRAASAAGTRNGPLGIEKGRRGKSEPLYGPGFHLSERISL